MTCIFPDRSLLFLEQQSRAGFVDGSLAGSKGRPSPTVQNPLVFTAP
jgi:hypothetical protein